MNFHQTPEEIIKNSTAEQRILWNYIFLRFGQKIGLQQFYYCGLPGAGTELLTYSAQKLYFALQFDILFTSAAIVVITPTNLYDEGNVVSSILGNNAPVWDTTAAALKYSANPQSIKNIIFSRMSATAYIKIIGYRLSI